MLLERYQHPNGQLPGLRVELRRRQPARPRLGGVVHLPVAQRQTLGDDALPFLKRTFHMLLVNFTWWVNRKDRDGRNLFEGGFLGLDNIGVFDRSAPLPTGGYLEQADGTAWMALLRPEHAGDRARAGARTIRPTRSWRSSSTSRSSGSRTRSTAVGERDAPVGRGGRLLLRRAARPRRVVDARSRCARSSASCRSARSPCIDPEALARLPKFVEARALVQREPPGAARRTCTSPRGPGAGGRLMLSMLNDDKLRRVLARMLDPDEFLGDHGIRSLSRYHLDHPYVFDAGETRSTRVNYLPAESDTGMFGGNSNWRGPIWVPINALIVRALLADLQLLRRRLPGRVSDGLGPVHEPLRRSRRSSPTAWRASSCATRSGRRPVFGGAKKFTDDPRLRDHVLFYEYFHGDNGAGLGASHQTGWSAVIPALMQIFAKLSPEMLLTRDLLAQRNAEPASAAARAAAHAATLTRRRDLDIGKHPTATEIRVEYRLTKTLLSAPVLREHLAGRQEKDVDAQSHSLTSGRPGRHRRRVRAHRGRDRRADHRGRVRPRATRSTTPSTTFSRRSRSRPRASRDLTGREAGRRPRRRPWSSRPGSRRRSRAWSASPAPAPNATPMTCAAASALQCAGTVVGAALSTPAALPPKK